MRCAALCFVLLVASASAQDAPDPQGASEAVRAYTEAASTGDWAAAAALTDPNDLERFREVVAFMVQMDPATAGYAGLDSTAAPEESFASLMHFIAGMTPRMEEMLESAETTVLGAVMEGDSLAHVVARTRTEVFEQTVEAVAVSTVRWTGERWVVGLDDEMEGMLAGIEAARQNPGLLEDVTEEPAIYETDRDPKKRQ